MHSKRCRKLCAWNNEDRCESGCCNAVNKEIETVLKNRRYIVERSARMVPEKVKEKKGGFYKICPKSIQMELFWIGERLLMILLLYVYVLLWVSREKINSHNHKKAIFYKLKNCTPRKGGSLSKKNVDKRWPYI